MGAQGNHYELGLMIILLVPELGSDALLACSLFNETEGQNGMKSTVVVFLLERHHRRNAVHILQNDGGHPCKDAPSTLNRMLARDTATIYQHETIKLSKVAPILKVILRRYHVCVHDKGVDELHWRVFVALQRLFCR